MWSSYVIIVSLVIICHFTWGYSNNEYGKPDITQLEETEEFNRVLNGRVKRAIGDNNEVGGDNDNKNGDIITTTETNVVEYVAPDSNVNNNVSMKTIVTEAPAGADNTSDSTTSSSGAILTSSNSQSDVTTKIPVNEDTIDNPNNHDNSMTNTTTAIGNVITSTQTSVTVVRDSDSSPISNDNHLTGEATNTSSTDTSDTVSNNPENATSSDILGTTPSDTAVTNVSDVYSSNVTAKPLINSTNSVIEVSDLGGNNTTEAISASTNSPVSLEMATNTSVTNSSSEVNSTSSVIPEQTTVPSVFVNETKTLINDPNSTVSSQPSVTQNPNPVNVTTTTVDSLGNKTNTSNTDSGVDVSNSSTVDTVITIPMNDITTESIVHNNISNSSESAVIGNTTTATLKPVSDNHTMASDTTTKPGDYITESSSIDINNTTVNPIALTNATDIFIEQTTKEPDISNVTLDPTPESGENATNPTNDDGSETSPEPESETSPEPESETSPEPESETSPKPESETSPEPESETSPEPESETSPKPESKTSPEPESETSPEPESETSPEPGSETSPEPTPEKTSPEPTPEKTSPEPTPEKTSPEPTPEKTSPEPTPEKTSPEPTPEKTSPESTPEKTSPEPTPETNPEPTPEKTSPEPTPEKTSPEPTPEKTSPEPTPETNPESDPEAEGEPEGEGEPKPESELDAFAEPGPDWELAKKVWQEAWEFHVYFFGVAFALLGVYSLITLIRLWDMDHLVSKHYFVTLHLLVILVCVLRSVYLLLDAYNSYGTFPVGVDYFMYSTAFPCLTALFSILFYSLLLATRVRVMSKKVQKLWVLLVIVILHFVLSIVTDIVVGILSNAYVLILVCQVFFIVWGLLMFIGYLFLFRKLYKGAIQHQKSLSGLQNEHKSPVLHGHGYQSKPKHRYTFGLAVKITFISAFFGIAIVGFELYGIFGVYGALSDNSKPEPWPWWTYHVIVRTLELLMCLSVTFVASQPLRYKLQKKSSHRIYHYMLPCCLCCCPGNVEHSETFSSSGSLDCVVSEADHLSWLKKIKNKKTPSPQAPYPPHTAEKYSDPDATLLVRRVKRVNKPSMLVVEDGFVRIRTEDEVLPSNQFELDSYSQSSHSSGNNLSGLESSNTGAINNVVNSNYTGHNRPNNVPVHSNVPGLNLDNYILQGYSEDHDNASVDNNDDTDIDIVITDSENEDNDEEILDEHDSGESNQSADIFRPLSMIDFAASMESELDRAFHSSCVEETDLISHNSLPASLEGLNSDSNAYNEPMYRQYFENEAMASSSYHDTTNYSSDSGESKSSATKLLHSPVRRCKSDDSSVIVPTKCKHFERNKYFSLSRVDTIAQEDIKYTEL